MTTRHETKPSLDLMDLLVLEGALAGDGARAIARSLGIQLRQVEDAVSRLRSYMRQTQSKQLAAFKGGMPTGGLEKRIAVQAGRSLDTLSKCLDRVQ